MSKEIIQKLQEIDTHLDKHHKRFDKID